jgi:hypothetical protein
VLVAVAAIFEGMKFKIVAISYWMRQNMVSYFCNFSSACSWTNL